ncbi:MAG: PEP-CTERM sorting domain-containing protein, partial [Planctomycetes bacterium]|nr:PEP-CTERM sorting domain-containing protein [Planctomycetota bacterium]
RTTAFDNVWFNQQSVAAAVPEPSTFALAALGLLGLGWYGRRRRMS